MPAEIEILKKYAKAFSEIQYEKLLTYTGLLYDIAMPAGFIGEADKHTVFLRHTLDSVLPMAYHQNLWISDLKTICDLGAGAGLPSIPLAICMPEKNVVSIDSQQKRLAFCEQAGLTLGLQNYRTIFSVAEKVQRDASLSPQLIVFRAFRKILAALELALPLARPGVKVLYYRSKEINFSDAGLQRLKELGYAIEEFQQYNAPEELGNRGGYVFTCIDRPAAGYPRKWKKIQADELVQRES